MGKYMVHNVIDEDGALWVQPCQLMKKISVSRTTVWRMLNRMRDNRKYKDSFLDLSFHMKLVKQEDFFKFLHEENGAYLRK